MIHTWLQASRLFAQVNIAIPLIFGQALAFAYTGIYSWRMTVWIHLYGLLNQLLIVYANDAVDYPTDRENKTFNQFSGGSRVVPEGKLQPATLLKAAVLVLFLLVLICILLSVVEQRHGLWGLLAWGLLTFTAYNFPPFHLSYRGYGEILQGIGTGIILPMTGFYVQTASYLSFHWIALIPSFLLGIACHILTSLPDFPSDTNSQKHTYAVRYGQTIARRHIVYVLFFVLLSTPLVLKNYLCNHWLLIFVPTLLCIGICLRHLSTADAENHQDCRKFVFWGGAAINYLLISWSICLLNSS